MFKVAFTLRDLIPTEETKCEICFASEADADAFYNDLESFVNKRMGGNSCVAQKSKPEKVSDVILYGYDPYIKELYRIG